MLAVLTPVLALLGIEVAQLTESVKRHAILWGVIGAFGVVCVAFLLVAINTALAYAVGPVVAPLIIAAVAALVAIVVLVIMRMQDAEAERKEAERKRLAESNVLLTTAIISAIPALLRSPLLREIGLPAGAAIASALLLRRGGPIDHHPEP
jgi:cobalamin synthase